MIVAGTGNANFESLRTASRFSRRRTANSARRRARKRTVDRVSRNAPAREDHSARAAAEVEIQAWGRGRRRRPGLASDSSTTVPARIGRHRRARNGNPIGHADGRWPGNPRWLDHRREGPPGPGRCSPRRRAHLGDAPLSFGTTTHSSSDNTSCWKLRLRFAGFRARRPLLHSTMQSRWRRSRLAVRTARWSESAG